MTSVVALGGGHGLAGSSGRLRSVFGIPPPGDLRRCLGALADPGSLWADAFEYRFTAGELEGHALGNLVIAGLAATSGDFEMALDEAGRLLGSVGRVIPATREPVVLKAVVRAADGNGADDVEGQVAVANSGRIAGVSLVPADARASQAALDALGSADQVVIGPGSLFTSVLAVVAVPAIREALAATRARKVYVCNLRVQRPETAGYDVAAHVDALQAHGLDVDDVVCHPGALPLGGVSVRVVERPVAHEGSAAHDPHLLAAALSDLVG